MAHPNYKRKHFLINKPFQLRYMLYTLILLLSITGVSIGSMYFGIWGSVLKELSDEGIRNQLIVANRIFQYEKARAIDLGEDSTDASVKFIRETELLSQREREIFKEILHRTNQRLLIYMIPLLIFIGWGTIFLTHKIAGPLYRLNKCFKDIKEGDLTVRAHLRKNDEAKWLADNFNDMTEHLESEVSAMKKSTSKIAAANPESNQAKGILEKILSSFKTSK